MTADYNNYYISQLQEMIQDQRERLNELAEQVKELKRQMKELASQPKSIEYNFEQLKIEKLEGTLHIGLGHSGDSKDMIEQLTVGQNTVQTPAAQQNNSVENAAFRDMLKSMDEFFVKEAPDYLRSLESASKLELDESYRIFILDDVHRQVPARLKHYIAKYQPGDDRGRQEIIQKTKEDIFRGIETFMIHLKDSKSTGGKNNEISRNQS
jgi:spore germination protein PC